MGNLFAYIIIGLVFIYDWLRRRSIIDWCFIVLLTIVFVILFFKGNPNEEQKKVNHIIMEDAVQVGDSIEAPWTEKTDSTYVSEESTGDFKIPKEKYWSSEETKLPIGVVYKMDFAKKGDKHYYNNNYITIKTLEGKLKIVKDVDEDLYLNLEIGDTIR